MNTHPVPHRSGAVYAYDAEAAPPTEVTVTDVLSTASPAGAVTVSEVSLCAVGYGGVSPRR